MQLRQIIQTLETVAPLSLQEDYDNSGLIVGNYNQEIHQAVVCIDATEAVIDEALDTGANLVIAHHPIVFKGLKRFNQADYVQRAVQKAIRHDIAIYAIHTNLDNAALGVNHKIAQIIGLTDTRVLQPRAMGLRKLITYVPTSHIEQVQQAVFDAGAGHIGNYDQCGYRSLGQGSFRANEQAKPYVGTRSVRHYEDEYRFETIFETQHQAAILAALQANHPYEEVAYDLIQLQQANPRAGAGLIGRLAAPEAEIDFLLRLKAHFQVACLRHTPLLGRPVQTVAVCGGSCSFLLKQAIGAKADVFVSADFKYHEFFDADGHILIADLGHYESEQYTVELILEILKEKIPNFAAYKSQQKTSPVNYL